MTWLSYLSTKRPTIGSVTAARFALGQRVRVRMGSDEEESSTPYYVRGRSGVVEEVCAEPTSPKRAAPDPARDLPMQSYRMRFLAREVWPGLPGAPGETLAVRIGEDWLENPDLRP